jgi:hypothetical protein
MPQHNAAVALVNGLGIAFENVEKFWMILTVLLSPAT